MGKSLDGYLLDLVLGIDRGVKSPFCGSFGAGVLTVAATGLFALTFLYHVGRPLLDAYQGTSAGRIEDGISRM